MNINAFLTRFSQLLSLFVAVVVGDTCAAQSTQTPQVAETSDYAVTQVGPHSQVWQNGAGQTVTQIQTGLNFWDGQNWAPSANVFVVSPDGTSFLANQIQDPTRISANLNTVGAVSATTPDGAAMSSTPVAIGLYDRVSGLSVIVATVTNSAGVLTDPQHVVFTNALIGGGFAAAVVYSLPDTGSFDQDVVFTGFNPGFDPTVWGFAASATNSLEIQIFTAFYQASQPSVETNYIYVEEDPVLRGNMASPDIFDCTLDFGDYVFGHSWAFTMSTDGGPSPRVPVQKDLITANGRTFLVESVSYQSLAAGLAALPPAPTTVTGMVTPPRRATRTRIAEASLPSLRDAKSMPVEKIKSGKGVVADAALPHGVSIDYIVTVSSLNEPKLYSSDTTYFVSGPVYETSPVTMESAVFKYPTNAGYIEIESTLTLTTTNYRTAIFTSADDASAGATLSTSIYSNYTGTVSGHKYGSIGLWLNTSANITLNNLRFCFLSIAVQINTDTPQQLLSVSHTQVIDCNEGIYVNGTGSASLNFYVYNCLIANVGTLFQMGNIILTNGAACNCTVDTCTNLFNVDEATTGKLGFTNSIFSTLKSQGSPGHLTLTGSSNGFYNSTSATFGTYTTVATSPYQPSGAGNYYLAGPAFLTNGTTNIPAALLSQLHIKTTEAPLFLTNTFTYSTILTPVVERDTSGRELGWHYDPIDFLSSCTLNAHNSLTLTNGVVLAYYNAQGIFVQHDSQLFSQGTPNQRDVIVYYGLVQEQPVSLGTNVAQSVAVRFDPVTNNTTSISLRLTTLCAETGETNLMNIAGIRSLDSMTLRDCEIYGSGALWYMGEDNVPGPTVSLTNNIFYRVPFSIDSYATISSINNLFYGTTNTNRFTISIRYFGASSNSSNTNLNNVFDGVAVALDGVYNHNAYLHGAVNTNNSTNTTDLWTNLTWQAGQLGAFYQPTNSPLLNNGSTNASNLGLFHYAVTTNNTVEGSNVVSRGYHYVVVGTNGLPLDSNSDGVPDYLEDANGDGTNNDAEPWNATNAPWIGTQPFNQYAVAGTPAIFSVVAYGTAPLSYQWKSNSINISSGTLSTYTIPSVANNDVATYSVTVTNLSGVVTSSDATLTVVPPPQLTNTFPPTNGQYWFQQSYDALSTVVTNAYYGSTTPAWYSQYLDPYLYFIPNYQWRFNGTNIPSASGTLLATNYISYVATNDGGTNTVIITNPAGSTNVTWTNVLQAQPGMVEAWGSDDSGECDRPAWLTNAMAIAAGEYQSMAVTDTGKVLQWGQYSDGTDLYAVTNTSTATQPPTNGVVAVAAGLGQGLALMTNGTLTAWGLNGAYGTQVPTNLNLTNVTAIACGWQFNVALSANGTVTAWGLNEPPLGYTMTNVPPGLSNVIAISAGPLHTVALKSNGTVVAWGYNPDGETNVPAGLSNVVAVAAGESHNLALLSNGTVVAWGYNGYGETNVPATIHSNAMAIACGDDHSVALLNNGTLVAWGDNSSDQTNIPQSNPTTPVDVKLVAAAGDHTMAGIFSSWVQYPVNVARDLLLIYNSNSVDSSTVFTYYTNNRPMVSTANVLALNCTNGEIVYPTDFANTILAPVQGWLKANVTKRPSYIILFPDIPSRVESNGVLSAGVQYQISTESAANWRPFVSSINMNGTGGTNDCIQYINKLAFIGSNYSPGRLILSASTGRYGNTNYYFDDTENGYNDYQIGGAAAQAVGQVGVASNSITYENVYPDCNANTCHITSGSNVVGYLSWGAHSWLGTNYATNGSVVWTGNSGWYSIATIESFNGQRVVNPVFPTANFLSWYASNAFGGINYSNTPVAAISNVEEPNEPTTNYGATYFGLWAEGKTAGICGWNAAANGGNPLYLQEVGDPLVTK